MPLLNGRYSRIDLDIVREYAAQLDRTPRADYHGSEELLRGAKFVALEDGVARDLAQALRDLADLVQNPPERRVLIASGDSGPRLAAVDKRGVTVKRG